MLPSQRQSSPSQSTDLDDKTTTSQIEIPENWKSLTITFHGTIEAGMNVIFATLGHRVDVKEGSPNIITIHRVPQHRRSYLRQFLQGFIAQHPETTVAFTARDETTKFSNRSAENDAHADPQVSQIIAEGWEKLRRALFGNV